MNNKEKCVNCAYHTFQKLQIIESLIENEKLGDSPRERAIVAVEMTRDIPLGEPICKRNGCPIPKDKKIHKCFLQKVNLSLEKQERYVLMDLQKKTMISQYIHSFAMIILTVVIIIIQILGLAK